MATPPNAKSNTSTSTKPASGAPEGWDKVNTGFAPYVKSGEGMEFQAIVLEKDENDENFIRYLCQATKPLKAFRGPKDGAEEVQVNPGDFFTVSPAANLNLDGMMGREVHVKCTGKIKANTKSGFVWGFQVHVNPKIPTLPAGYAGQLSQNAS